MVEKAHTSTEFVIAGLGFCVLGMLIGLVATAALQRCSQESEDYDVNVRIITDLPSNSETLE